jgi:hypothetical protein
MCTGDWQLRARTRVPDAEKPVNDRKIICNEIRPGNQKGAGNQHFRKSRKNDGRWHAGFCESVIFQARFKQATVINWNVNVALRVRPSLSGCPRFPARRSSPRG